MRKLFFIAITVLFASSLLFAGQLAVSTFDTSDEGWTNSDFQYPGGYSFIGVNWSATGGNPGGHIQVVDNFPENGLYAPAKFLGNQSAAFGGTLTWDEYDSTYDAVNDGPWASVLVSDGTTNLWTHRMYIGTSWSTYSVTFLGANFCNSYEDSCGVSDATLLGVLSNLEYLGIYADYHFGLDDANLDNVILNSGPVGTPEPCSLLLLGCGLAALAGMRRK